MPSEYTLHPHGDLDLTTVEDLCVEWLHQIDQHRPDRLVLDMSEVSFIDSSGLGAIARLLKRQRTHNGVVSVTNAAPMHIKLLRLTGMHHLVDIDTVPGP